MSKIKPSIVTIKKTDNDIEKAITKKDIDTVIQQMDPEDELLLLKEKINFIKWCCEHFKDDEKFIQELQKQIINLLNIF